MEDLGSDFRCFSYFHVICEVALVGGVLDGLRLGEFGFPVFGSIDVYTNMILNVTLVIII